MESNSKKLSIMTGIVFQRSGTVQRQFEHHMPGQVGEVVEAG